MGKDLARLQSLVLHRRPKRSRVLPTSASAIVRHPRTLLDRLGLDWTVRRPPRGSPHCGVATKDSAQDVASGLDFLSDSAFDWTRPP